MDEMLLKSFVESVGGIEWFSHAGERCQDARTVLSMQGAWDGEGKQMLELWGKQTRLLESEALNSLDDHEIDQIFCTVSDAIHEALYFGLSAYIDRVYNTNPDTKERTFDEGVFAEVIESAKRDVSWAGVEHLLGIHGFFSNLLEVYRRGRWACSWDGDFPKGRPVLL